MNAASTPRAWAALAQKHLPHAALVALLREFGGPDAVLAATRPQLARVVPEVTVDRVLVPPDTAGLELTVAWLAQPGHELIAWDDPDYPQALLELGFAPPVLYFVGQRQVLNRPALAIVGSRNATAQGRDNAQAFGHALSEAGLAIVSGLALGIDAAAHRGGLAGRAGTLAVVGTGPDRVYPARHRDLAHAIVAHGGMVSEFPPGTPPASWNFPRRNRLISGLARGVLVVEAALSSGSLITARYAGEQGREVFAIPGSIHSPLAKGCHKLIREGAKLVETAQDILVELGLAAPAADVSGAASPQPDSALLAALGDDPVGLDTLIERTGMPADTLLAELTELDIAGAVSPVAGGRWQRRRGPANFVASGS
jgi:DNA processing protein